MIITVFVIWSLVTMCLVVWNRHVYSKDESLWEDSLAAKCMFGFMVGHFYAAFSCVITAGVVCIAGLLYIPYHYFFVL